MYDAIRNHLGIDRRLDAIEGRLDSHGTRLQGNKERSDTLEMRQNMSDEAYGALKERLRVVEERLDGHVGRLSIPPSLAWLCLYLVVVNVVAWGLVGLVAVADLTVGWFS